jgi:hypothetical protein
MMAYRVHGVSFDLGYNCFHLQFLGCGQSLLEQGLGPVSITAPVAVQEHEGKLVARVGQPRPRTHPGIQFQS